MKLNDPFGRLERRNQANYALMRDAMIQGGIETEQAALEVIETSKQKLIKFMAVVLAGLVLFVCFVPKSWPIMLCIAGMVLIWGVKSVISGRRYVERYIKEEISP